MPTIFYAWQSDRPTEICHTFIRECANEAILRLKQKFTSNTTVEDAPPPPDLELDHDTKNVAGSPHIAETIKRKIATCDIFLADVSHVAPYTTTEQRKRQKKAQNGNVLIELGYALALKPSDRILLVMNTAFGSFSDLPFDLRHHRRPLHYELADGADDARRQKVKDDLVRQLSDALELILTDVAKAAVLESQRLTAEEEAAGRQQAEQKWNDFWKNFKSNRFAGIKTVRISLAGGGVPAPDPRAFITVSIVPIRPLTNLLDIEAVERDNPRELRPILYSQVHSQGTGTSLVYFDREAEDEPIYTAVELTEYGAVFAAQEIMGVTTRSGKHRVFELDILEVAVIRAMARYVQLLRRLKIKGALEIRIALYGVVNSYFTPANQSRFKRVDFRENTNDAVILRPVTLPAECDGKDMTLVASTLRTPFTIVWRDAGLPRDPCFDEGGRYLRG